jgi:hypothetical protein
MKEPFFSTNDDTYNSIIGSDYRVASKNNTWERKYFIHESFSPNVKDKEHSTGFSTEYFGRKINFSQSEVYVGDHFRSDLGFIRRADILKIIPKIESTFLV